MEEAELLMLASLRLKSSNGAPVGVSMLDPRGKRDPTAELLPEVIFLAWEAPERDVP